MTIENVHAYCDEAGNTGANLLDNDQPLLLVGKWVIHGSFVDIVRSIIQKYTDILQPFNEELHGNRLLRSESGIQSIFNIIRDMCDLNCIPVCQFAEKRYVLAGHVMDIFLSPESNPKIPNS